MSLTDSIFIPEIQPNTPYNYEKGKKISLNRRIKAQINLGFSSKNEAEYSETNTWSLDTLANREKPCQNDAHVYSNDYVEWANK